MSVTIILQGASQSCKSRGETLFKALDSRRFNDYAFVLITKVEYTLFFKAFPVLQSIKNRYIFFFPIVTNTMVNTGLLEQLPIDYCH